MASVSHYLYRIGRQYVIHQPLRWLVPGGSCTLGASCWSHGHILWVLFWFVFVWLCSKSLLVLVVFISIFSFSIHCGVDTTLSPQNFGSIFPPKGFITARSRRKR